MVEPGQDAYWIRFEDVDGRVIEDNRPADILPDVGQLIPVQGTHCEVMEQWVDQTLAAEGGPKVIVFTIKPLA